MKLAESIAQSLRAAASSNSYTSAVGAAVLWPDKEGLWRTAIPQLAPHLPSLLVLGPYDSARGTGPAIWLKCAIAGALQESQFAGQVPVIYMPGVSRADLRAIEDCPRDLQPLAELQYRGAFWSQANTKDWTISAFLSSKNGGLALDVAHDRSTQDSLQRAVDAGVLLDRTVDELQVRSIDSAWLDSLLAPNPTRDILVWLNDPQLAQQQWSGGRWDVFVSRCKKDFGFDPQTDGALSAAEKLAGRAGSWGAVWELYRDSFAGFPHVEEQLGNVQPPAPKGLFDDINDRAGYPRANADAERELRDQLIAIGSMAPAQARAAIVDAEKTHGERRQWLWSRMGRAPLAQALEHLADLSSLSVQVPGGSTPDQQAASYQEGAWRVDGAALKALAAVQAKVDVDAVSAALRAAYLPWLEEVAERFQEVVKAQGGLSPGAPAAKVDAAGLCTVFVDGLRYDVAHQLQTMLGLVGTASLSADWTSIPSVTASGKAWASPVAHAVAGKKTDEDFQPSLVADGKPLSTHNLRRLLEEHGVQVLSRHDAGDPSGRAWVECGDLDHYGHEHGLRLARDMAGQLGQIVERLLELKEAGWARFRIVTDHGWLLVPGGLPKTELLKHEAQTGWGRCAVLKDTSHGTPLTFGWDWCRDVQIAMAPGISSFIAGAEYAHGGLTLQECLVPVLDVQVALPSKSAFKVDITKVAWKGLRCHVEVSPTHAGLTVDIRTKAALAGSSVVAKAKPVEEGKASLAVADDSYMGSAAFVVVLDAGGAVVQKASTTIGE